MFQTIFWLPYGSDLDSLGYYSFFFPAPCGQLYAAGLAIAALAIIPVFRRLFRLRLATTGVLCILFCDVALLALTNYGFPQPSPKRTYHLLPLQAFFCVLPLYALASIAGRSSALAKNAITAVAFVAVVAYAAANISIFVFPDRFGGTIKDGMVELRQRFPETKVLMFDLRQAIKTAAEDSRSLLNRMYRIGETISVTAELNDAMVAEICAQKGIVCRFNKEQTTATPFRDATAPHRDRLSRINLYDVPELDCFLCR
jgi:hypothetical protein